jgi:Tat protein translocase TatB subunit
VRNAVPGPQELLVILVVALLVFGPDRLPELARGAARVINRLKAETDRSLGELKRAAAAEGFDEDWREVSRELREARDQLRRPLGGAASAGGLTSGGGIGRGGPGWRAEEDPPPVDTEAT